jgi:hypothetical protein
VAHRTRKGKEKRRRDEDIPGEPSDEVRLQFVHLVELREHLWCQKHSAGTMKTYCWIEPATAKNKSEHRAVDHQEMTLWAKLIVSETLLAVTIKISPLL